MKRVLGMLGMCMRAGKLVTGEKACVQAVRSNKVVVCVLDEGAAHNAQKAVRDACTHHEVALIVVPKDSLGDSIGKPGRMVAGITDERMAERVLQLSREA